MENEEEFRQATIDEINKLKIKVKGLYTFIFVLFGLIIISILFKL